MLKVLYQKYKAKYSKLNVKTEEKTVTDSSQQPSQQKVRLLHLAEVSIHRFGPPLLHGEEVCQIDL
jgi:hypothetical protein